MQAGASVKEIIIEALCPRSESGEKWLNLGYILKIEQIGYAGRLDLGCEEETGIWGRLEEDQV